MEEPGSRGPNLGFGHEKGPWSPKIGSQERERAKEARERESESESKRERPT